MLGVPLNQFSMTRGGGTGSERGDRPLVWSRKGGTLRGKRSGNDLYLFPWHSFWETARMRSDEMNKQNTLTGYEVYMKSRMTRCCMELVSIKDGELI